VTAGGKFRKLNELFTFIPLWCCVVGALSGPARGADTATKETMQLTSTAFAEGNSIPVRYTCDGENVSPPFKWNGAPASAKSFTLIVDDPDAPAGIWVHWLVYDLPPTSTELPEGAPKSQYLPGGARQGLNDFKHLGYGGPCPPPGKAHRYFFKLFALDRVIELKPGATKKELEAAMEGHKLAEGQLIGIYKRK
jgi:Raf kinase inhibitor-like YbhB/YbcL family protein